MRCLSTAVLSISVLSQGCFLATRKPVTRYDRVVSFVAGGALIAGGASLMIYDRNKDTHDPSENFGTQTLNAFIGEVGIVLGIAFVVHGLLLHDWTPPVAQPPMYPAPTPGPYPAPYPAPGTYAPPPSNAAPTPSAPSP